MAFNYFDVMVVCVLALFALRGCLRGFVGEVAGVAGLIGGLWLAHRFHGPAAAYLPFIDDPVWRAITAYTLVFLTVLLAVGVLRRVLRKILSFSFVSWADKLAGFLLGLFKGLIICSLLLLAAQRFAGDSFFLHESRTLPYLDAMMGQIRAYLPAGLWKDLSFL